MHPASGSPAGRIGVYKAIKAVPSSASRPCGALKRRILAISGLCTLAGALQCRQDSGKNGPSGTV